MRLPLLLLLLASCAPKGPSTPTTYAKGAYRPAPARAPAFSPTEDAPHVFEPGRPSPVQPGPRYAPVPHTPQTRAEPTIWASHPREPGSGGLVPVLDDFIPAPADDDDAFQDEREHIKVCAEQVDRNARLAIGDVAVRGMDPLVRACLARELMAECLAQRHYQFTSRGPHPSRRPGADHAKVIVERGKDTVCIDAVRPFVNAERNRLKNAGYRNAP